MQVLLPGSRTVRRGHDLSEELECGIGDALPMTTVFVHLELLEDEATFATRTWTGRTREAPHPGTG